MGRFCIIENIMIGAKPEGETLRTVGVPADNLDRYPDGSADLAIGLGVFY